MSALNKMSDEMEAAIKAAMIVELGNSRLEDLPMEDGEGRLRGAHESRRVYSHPPALASDIRPVPVNKKWGQAIERGAFDDDDAAQVAGMDTMANGNLARQRRAGNIAFNHVSQHYTEKSLRRDQHGHVAPRTNFESQSRATRLVPGKIHVGDGPINMEAALSSARPAGSGPRGPSPSPHASGLMRTQSSARTPSRLAISQPVAAQKEAASPRTSTPSVTSQVQSKAPQVAQPTLPAQMRMVLPDGACIFLQLSATIQSTAFPQRKSIPGTVLLITGREPPEDMIVFAFDDKDADEVRHRISEYTDYMTKENGLMLLFTVSGGLKLFYAVVFEQSDARESFIESLRTLVNRPDQEARNAASASAVAEESLINATHSGAKTEDAQTEAPRLVVKIEPLQPTARIQPVQPTIAVTAKPMETVRPQVSEVVSNKPKSDRSALFPNTTIEEPEPQVCFVTKETEAVVAAQAHHAAAASASTQQPDPPFIITPELIKEMVSWVMSTTGYMRDCVPEELCFDTIRAIIRATAAAVVVQRYPNFHQLDAKVRAQVVEVQCRPAVERGFLGELAKNPALARKLAGQDADNEDAGQITTDPQPARPQQDAKIPVKVSQKPTPPKYEMDKLIALRCKAVTPPRWLSNFDELTKAALPATQRPSRRYHAWDGPSHSHIPSVQDQVQQTSTKHMDWPYPSHSPLATDTQPTETVGGDFGDVSHLFGGQEGQALTVGQHREAGNTQAVRHDLPNNTALGGSISPFAGTIQHVDANSLGVQSSISPLAAKNPQSHLHGTTNDHQVEEIASFLAGPKPASQKKAFPFPPPGLKASRHNIGGSSDHIGQNTDHFPVDSAQGSTYSQELSGLFENDMNQKVAQTTEDLRKLSLGN